MDVVPDIALLAHKWRPRVDADAHADRPVACQSLREVRGGGESAGRRGEGKEEGVSLRVDLDAAVSGAGLPNDRTVICKRRRILLRAQLAQQ